MCTACCCRADICEETTRSAFLRLLLERQDLEPADLDDRFGWLYVDGCALDYGRPPVCHFYFCEELLASFPPDDRQLIRVLGRLVDYVGEEALEHTHLTVIDGASDFEGIRLDHLMERLETAGAVRDVIARYFEEGRITQDGLELIAAIPAEGSHF